MNEPEVMQRMLEANTVAVVGLSDNPDRPSHYVAAYLQNAGKQILPVNPAVSEVLGERSFASLSALPVRPDVVNVFRLPRALPPIVDEMIALGLTSVWVQSGIINTDAATKAEANGIAVVMDRCMMVEYRLRARR